MNRTVLSSITLALLLAGGVLAQSASSGTNAEGSPGASAPAKATRPSGYPFRGKLKAVNADALTFTLAGKEKDRVFHVTAATKFVRDGKAVALKDAVTGEDVAGYARNEADGKILALSVRFGSTPAVDPQQTPTRKAPKPTASAP